jgi:uncharacterized protein (TIGR02118 family)
MYILTVTYPTSNGATFDFEYFRSRHLPKVGKAFGQFGLGYASVLRGEESVGGGEPAYFATTILSFATEQGARDAVASDAAKTLMADIANFTSVTPVMQFNSAVD